jgi:4-hydroxythreonine-4-phosphate dehydrogenase
MVDGKVVVGISHGDINGIGMEVIIKSLIDPMMSELCVPVVFGSNKMASAYRKILGIEDFSFHPIKEWKDLNLKKPNIFSVYEEDVNLELGQQTANGGNYALKSLQAATQALHENEIDVLVTAPINKENIQSAAFNFPGHTEYLEQEFGEGKSLMFLISEKLRVAVATGHIPVTKVAQALTVEGIVGKLQLLNQSLKTDFQITKPKIAVLGLNPHAGDNGVIGNEEKEIIIPAIHKAKEENMLVFGPFSADGFFGNESYKNYDAVLAMYHDQGLIPFKTIAFNTGVNFTAGIRIVRTSPDHGTAYDIAGKNCASEESFRTAIFAAIDIFRNRILNQELTSNPLKVTQQRKERER